MSKSHQGKKRGVPSRDELYVKIASHANKAIEVVVGIMTGRRKPNAVALGAAKIILNKVLPDLRAQEGTANDNQQISIRIVGEGGVDPLMQQIGS